MGHIGGSLHFDGFKHLAGQGTSKFVGSKNDFLDEVIRAGGAGGDADSQFAVERQPVFGVRHLVRML